jgi:glycosyltransferase involved in cell wall biosynthesis
MQNKLHILVPIRYPVGGIRTYLRYTYGKLSPGSYHFTFILNSKLWLNRIADDLHIHSKNFVLIESNANFLSFVKSILYTINKIKPDLVHSHGFTAGLATELSTFYCHLPHVITLHRIFGHDDFSTNFWGRKAFLKKTMMSFLLRRADVIQSVSNDAQANLIEFLPSLSKKNDKLLVILNGIDIAQFSALTDLKVNHFTKKSGFFYVGFFGRYMPEKGFLYLVDVIDILVKRKITNIVVIAVGGFGEYIREYRKEISRRGLDDHFLFLDFFENISPILQEIDILAIPSLSEACPLIPMEGLVCGTPVVAFSCLGLREVLANTPARLVPVADTNSFADKIVNILSNFQNIKEEFKKFIPVAQTRYDVTNTAEQLSQVFKKLTHYQ